MITIEVDDKRVLDVIAELQRRMSDMTPAMQSVGEYLVASTHARFATSIGPNGVPWAPNTETTYIRMIEQRAGTILKKGPNAGRVNVKGTALALTKKPLIGETHRLENELITRADADSVTVGSNMIYAAVQQFGEERGTVGSTKRGSPIPWGDIPPRPFLGLSTGDADNVLAIVGLFLAAATG
jgi:phage gpG-like protein